MKPIVQDLIFFALLACISAWILQQGISTFLQTPVDKGDITVYGSKACPWCVKQEEYLKNKGIPYRFVDCVSEKCPEFVDGFPTLIVNGQVKSGYTEV
jgi:glutaredoxin